MSTNPGDGPLHPQPLDAEALWRATEALRHTPEVADARRAGRRLAARRRRRPILWLLPSMAAAGMILVLRLTDAGPIERSGLAEIRELVLEDGSHVTLDASSAIRTRFSARERSVELVAGRAEFDVTHDASRPFVVSAGATRVRAVGTRFTMEREGGDLEVVMLEGTVTVEPDRWLPQLIGSVPDPVSLSAGRKIEVAAAGRMSGAHPVDVARAATWREKRLDLDDKPLSWAIAQANRYSAEQIRLANPDLGALHVTTIFKAGDNAELAAALSARFGLELTRPSPGVILLGPAQKNLHKSVSER